MFRNLFVLFCLCSSVLRKWLFAWRSRFIIILRTVPSMKSLFLYLPSRRHLLLHRKDWLEYIPRNMSSYKTDSSLLYLFPPLVSPFLSLSRPRTSHVSPDSKQKRFRRLVTPPDPRHPPLTGPVRITLTETTVRFWKRNKTRVCRFIS